MSSSRALLAATLAATVLLASCAPAEGPTSDTTGRLAQPSMPMVTEASVASALRYLRTATDMHASTGPRLPASFAGAEREADDATCHTYDAAVAVLALLAGKRADDLVRARAIGEALISLQDADPARDGRLRNTYDPTDLRPRTDVGASTGNNAWAGLALVRLYLATGERAFLDSARRVAAFLETVRVGEGGLGGGVASDGSRIAWQSTEHNIDAAAFLGQLAAATGEQAHADAAARSRAMVTRMWDEQEGRFHVGTREDGSVNDSDHPVEDAQSWGYLLLGRERIRALDFAARRLVIQDPDSGALGATFSTGPNPGRTAWLEGSAHLALALRGSSLPRDVLARRLLADVSARQLSSGAVPAASGRGKSGGDEDILPVAHVGATAWFVLAATGTNPLR